MFLKSVRNFLKIDIPTNRVFGLDLLRMIAISIVMVSHAGQLLEGNVRKVYDAFFFQGNVGVSIFFVLSGFLIGGILIKTISNQKTSKIDFKFLFHFWKRRWFRTLPTYYLILILLILLEYIYNSNFTFRGIYTYLFFCQSLKADISNFFFVESWSISIEEWFYLIFPLIIWLISKIVNNVKSTFIVSVLIMFLFSTIYRVHYYYYINSVANHFINSTFSRLDSISFGVFASFLSHYYYNHWIERKKSLLIIGILIFIIFKINIENSTNNILINIFSYPLLSIATLFTLPYLSTFKLHPEKFKIITKISLISYSIFLLNLTLIQHWIIHQIPWFKWIENHQLLIFTRYIIYWIFVFVASILLHKYYEVPLTNLRDKKNKKV